MTNYNPLNKYFYQTVDTRQCTQLTDGTYVFNSNIQGNDVNANQNWTVALTDLFFPAEQSFLQHCAFKLYRLDDQFQSILETQTTFLPHKLVHNNDEMNQTLNEFIANDLTVQHFLSQIGVGSNIAFDFTDSAHEIFQFQLLFTKKLNYAVGFSRALAVKLGFAHDLEPPFAAYRPKTLTVPKLVNATRPGTIAVGNELIVVQMADLPLEIAPGSMPTLLPTLRVTSTTGERRVDKNKKIVHFSRTGIVHKEFVNLQYKSIRMTHLHALKLRITNEQNQPIVFHNQTDVGVIFGLAYKRQFAIE